MHSKINQKWELVDATRSHRRECQGFRTTVNRRPRRARDTSKIDDKETQSDWRNTRRHQRFSFCSCKCSPTARRITRKRLDEELPTPHRSLHHTSAQIRGGYIHKYSATATVTRMYLRETLLLSASHLRHGLSNSTLHHQTSQNNPGVQRSHV